MNNLAHLSISVESFFTNANWLGIHKTATSESLAEENKLFSLTLESTVGDFFTYNNWQGLDITEQISSNENEVNTPPVLSLTMSVGDFFNLMEWKGRPNIAPNPSKATSKSFSNDNHNQGLKINDLSNLF
jgi:hypothetical protein